jgi:prepilin-type N-terminal cleavage/methylation domain-containing protein
LRAAFSLIELLMVVAIIGIVTAITLPQLVASMRGNRLREATRTVVTAGRYARSMALLRQEEMILSFVVGGNEVSVRPAGSSSASSPEDAFGDDPPETLAAPAAALPDEDLDSRRVSATGMEEMHRTLDRVQIEYVDFGGETGPVSEGPCTILYSNNGRCTPYTVRIRDEFDAAVVVEVDALSTVRTEGE